MGKNSRRLPKTAKQLKKRLWEHLGKRCFYCGDRVPANSITGDHVFPNAQGYSACNNLVPACLPCNMKKADDLPSLDLIERVQALYDDAGETFDPCLTIWRGDKRPRGPEAGPTSFFNYYASTSRCPDFALTLRVEDKRAKV